MAILSHRGKASLRNYIGRPSCEQLRAWSDILSGALSGRLHHTCYLLIIYTKKASQKVKTDEILTACARYLQFVLCTRVKTLQSASLTALLSWAVFMSLWILLSFIHKTHALSSLFSNCHVKRVNPKPDSTEHFTFRFYILETKKLQAKVLKSTYQTVSVCKLLQIVNFDGFTFLTALVLFNQSDYLNHSNKDSDWLIVACFLRTWSMLTTLLFTLETKRC